MSKKLYVGNLLHGMTQEELAEAFAAWGPVASAIIITDHETGQSRGFGFVELPDDKVSEAAVQMNGARLNGRPLVVNEARPREGRAGGSARPGGFVRREGYPSPGPNENYPPGDRDHGDRSAGRDRNEGFRGEPRSPSFSPGPPPESDRGRSERGRSERDRGRKDAGGRKERGGKRGREFSGEDDW